MFTLRERIMACTRCGLRRGCNSPVAYSGPEQSSLLFIGEAPGEKEDKPPYLPFQGAAGREFNNYLWQIFLSREEVRVGNVVRCRPTGNRDPKMEEVAACFPWTMEELLECDPDVIITMGAFATKVLYQGDVNIGDVHGVPKRVSFGGKERWVFPTYHPAAGLHSTRDMRFIQEDFHALRSFLNGEDNHVQDQYPEPEYAILKTASEVLGLNEDLCMAGHFSMDTESTPDGKIWCASISAYPGQAFVIWPGHLPFLQSAISSCEVTFHFVLYDLGILEQVGLLPKPENLGDTMMMAYLLGEPQGLKDLARKLIGMEMEDYQDVVGPYHMDLRMDYLERAAGVPVPRPEKRKLSITTKIRKAMKECSDAAGLKKRWDGWGTEEKAPIVEELGDLPTGSLADVYENDPEKAIWYAARDADATERVKVVMERRMRAW